jgi:hypothetical protein
MDSKAVFWEHITPMITIDKSIVTVQSGISVVFDGQREPAVDQLLGSSTLDLDEFLNDVSLEL